MKTGRTSFILLCLLLLTGVAAAEQAQDQIFLADATIYQNGSTELHDMRLTDGVAMNEVDDGFLTLQLRDGENNTLFQTQFNIIFFEAAEESEGPYLSPPEDDATSHQNGRQIPEINKKSLQFRLPYIPEAENMRISVEDHTLGAYSIPQAVCTAETACSEYCRNYDAGASCGEDGLPLHWIGGFLVVLLVGTVLYLSIEP